MGGLRLDMSLSLTGSGGAFDPLTASPDLLYDASDLDTLFQNSNGTGAVTADADPVGYLGDTSGNAKHFTEVTAGWRPLLDITTGKYSLQFDGVDDQIGSTSGPLLSDLSATGSEFELVVGGKFNTVATDDASYLSNDAIIADGGGYFGIGARSSGKLGCSVFDAGPQTAEDLYMVGQAFVLNVRWTGGVLTVQVDNRAPVTATTAGNGVIDSVANGMRLASSGALRSDMNIYCLFGKKAVLSVGDRLSVRQWAASKAGVTL